MGHTPAFKGWDKVRYKTEDLRLSPAATESAGEKKIATANISSINAESPMSLG